IFLQPVELPQRCFLHEVLLWVAFQRLPVAVYTWNGKESREEYEIAGYSVEVGESYLTEDETRRAGIPKDPQWVALLEETTTLPVSHYDRFLRQNDLGEELRQKLESDREEAARFQAESEAWTRHYSRAIEYPASRIFVALRDGSLSAQGRRLPDAP